MLIVNSPTHIRVYTRMTILFMNLVYEGDGGMTPENFKVRKLCLKAMLSCESLTGIHHFLDVSYNTEHEICTL